MLPTKIGRYEIRKELGRGMMGIVYEAHDPALGRTIALKTIQLAFAVSEGERESFEERFLTEARVAARLSHPGIVVVHDVGQDADVGTLFIALEFLRGRTLAEVMTAGTPIGWRGALHIVKRVAEALHHAHCEGVIHRDIKPANIMMLPSGEPKIMDFGIAKIEASQLTATGQFFGTPLYMSPEQALGRKLDPRSDLFSLGALAYGLLTGQQAFGGAGVPRIITRVLGEDPDPPSHVVRSLPPEVDYLIARALAKGPDDRYPNGKVLAEDIEDVLSGRPPRHRGGWVAPRRAEGTLVSSRAEEGPGGTSRSVRPPSPAQELDSPLAALVAEGERRPARPPSATPPARTRQALPWAGVVAAAVIAATIGGVLVMRNRGEGPPVGGDPAPASTPSAVPPPETLRNSRPILAPLSPEAPYERGPASEILPPPTVERAVPEPSPAQRSAAEPSAGEPARLAIDFEHTLKEGTLRIWVDEALVIEEALDSRVTRKVAALKLRKGRFEEALELNPGKHEVKVQVAWDENVKTEYIFANFTPGSTRRLTARLAGLGGLGVKRKLTLDWE